MTGGGKIGWGGGGESVWREGNLEKKSKWSE